MLTKTAARLALAAGLAIAGLSGLPAKADARSHSMFMEHHHNFHGGPFFGGPIFLGPPIVYEQPFYPAGACRELLARAERTGSPFWYRRWHQCRLQVYGVY